MSVTVVNVNDPPVILDQTFSVPENSQKGTDIGAISASDANGDKITFVINAASPYEGKTTFAVNNITGKLSVDLRDKNVTINFEIISLYILTLSVADKHPSFPMYDTALVTINVEDVNEPPVLEKGQSFEINEDATPGYMLAESLAVQDPDQSSSFVWTLQDSDDSPFIIDAISGNITYDPRIIFEEQQVVLANEMQNAQDEDRSGKTLLVGGFNTDKVLSSVFFSRYSTYAWSDDVPPNARNPKSIEMTIISGHKPHNWLGYPVSVTALNYEATREYSIKITVTDDDGLDSTETVVIDVLDKNEEPILLPGKFFVYENSPIGTVVGTVSATDPDGTEYFQFSVAQNTENNEFQIDETTGVISIAANTLDYEENPSKNISIAVRDSGSPPLSTSRTYEIIVLNENDLIIEKISLNRDNGNSIGSEPNQLSTSGEEYIYIYGSNIGSMDGNDTITATYTTKHVAKPGMG